MEKNKFVQFIIKQIKTVTIGKYTKKYTFCKIINSGNCLMGYFCDRYKLIPLTD